MNIKNIGTTPITPLEPKSRVEGNARAKGSADRDADGKREQKEPEIKRHLTQQEFDDAIKVLEALPGLKANNLTIKVEVQDDHRVITIVDFQGKVVRRLSESQLWSATRDRDKQTGRILDKAM
jgi:hypothetical protein